MLHGRQLHVNLIRATSEQLDADIESFGWRAYRGTTTSTLIGTLDR